MVSHHVVIKQQQRAIFTTTSRASLSALRCTTPSSYGCDYSSACISSSAYQVQTNRFNSRKGYSRRCYENPRSCWNEVSSIGHNQYHVYRNNSSVRHLCGATDPSREKTNNHTSLLSLLSLDDDDDNDKTKKDGFGDDTDDSGISDGNSSTTSMTNKNKKKMNIRSISRHQQERRKMNIPLSVPETTTDIPIPMKQTKANAELLFDSLAPHLEYRNLQSIQSKMEAFAKDLTAEHKKLQFEFQRNIEESGKRQRENVSVPPSKIFSDRMTLVGQMDALLDEGKKNNSKKAASTSADTTSLDAHPWVKILVTQFFAALPISSSFPSSSTSNHEKDTGTDPVIAYQNPMPIRQDTVWGDPTFTPNSNRAKFKRNVSILMKAREVCMESPLLWSNNQKKKLALRSSDKQNQQQQQQLEDDLRSIHYSKSPELLKMEAEGMASLLSDRLPLGVHEKLMDLLNEYANSAIGRDGASYTTSSNSVDDKNDYKKHTMKMLFPNLKNCTKFHIHLIASDVAKFFYVDIPQAVRDSSVANATVSESTSLVMEKDEERLRDGGGGGVILSTGDPRINEAWKDWNDAREEFVAIFLDAQHTYAGLQGLLHNEEQKQSTMNGLDEKIKDGNNDRSTDAFFDELRREKRNVKQLEQDGSSATDNDTTVRESKGKERMGRRPKNVKLNFECIMLNDRFGPYSKSDTAIAADFITEDSSAIGSSKHDAVCPEIAKDLPQTNKMIFLDNLPIDTTKEEIDELYSRCGPIKSIEIFNLRSDLDPGELSVAKRKERQKKNRLSGIKGASRRRRGERQRTPIYAIIEFYTAEGFNTATMDVLRIFGMVIRRHAVRSIPARNITSLHIENIPPGFFSLDVEDKLSKILHPDIHVSLNVGHHDYAEANSCEIKFPSFEATFYAYGLMKDLVDFVDESGNYGDCVLNWIRTPDNAFEYWTRELSVDT